MESVAEASDEAEGLLVFDRQTESARRTVARVTSALGGGNGRRSTLQSLRISGAQLAYWTARVWTAEGEVGKSGAGEAGCITTNEA